ncbi:Cytochrome c1 heme lyase [Coccidioides posadasii str. Silveira]|uniref:Holocytochrome c-type synthase n=2 Tax=Coccidioides posadasii TaxID=199306 RepID=E9D0T0_COCPS|nr:cytochrome C1 heme lyase, putative [Coccidioides posadasii C735 delta SOWgp]EER26094.1 cytochrome C1 heme lyase, putative [Coccidioides posadasii C735 delta SOWgp]EFW19934.1 cytochrome C1 heme lyase [Coccidioides posadasii str. Silveira]QVM08905.1 Cytochrome c1 heme lyase [Coccidioides posadasii str. Silveira]|eukprot:XP_003068239.1 cytochrome C1 heme lyase, putative [Coccidioides posadasii C735 delta SOWgp]
MGAGASTPSSTESTAAPPAASCPVDHKAREVWLSKSQAPSPPPRPNPEEISSCPVDHKARAAWLSTSEKSTNPAPEPSSTDSNSPQVKHRPLSTDREVSSIPRALSGHSEQRPPSQLPSPYAQQSSSAASHSAPSNSESETGHDQTTGNWVYPSERQFFEALMRKGTLTSTTSAKELATSVASIIPIHNAVNERAWLEILSWESRAPTSDPGSRKCGGPKLYSFRGLGTETQFLSPRARLNGLLGYQLPFDRHDWVVERCGGERVEYVIDFYQGKSGGGLGLGTSGPDGKLSFYLDVRPKLNSLEGWKMRIGRFLGLS